MFKNISKLGVVLSQLDQKLIKGAKKDEHKYPCYCEGKLISFSETIRNCYWRCQFTL